MKLWRKVSFAGALLGLLAGTVVLAEVKTTEPIALQMRAIGKQLQCQCGCASSVADCNMLYCHFRDPIREDMREALEAGLEPDAVLSKIIAKYGEAVRGQPRVEGWSALSWAMPFAALAVGFIIAPFVVSRWRKKAKTAERTDSQPVDPETIQRFEAEIERDLARED